MRRILQVSPHYPPLLGGLEQVVRQLAVSLAARGGSVRVLTTTVGAPAAPRHAVEDGVEVTRQRGKSIAHTTIAPALPAALLRVTRNTVVHLHCSQILVPEAVWLTCRARGVPYFVHFHMEVDASGRLGGLVLPPYKKHVFSRVLRAAAGVITLTGEQAQFVCRTYGVRAERVSVVPNGIAPEFFLPPRPPRPPADGPLRLLFVGRLSAQKNVGRLLQALSLCPEAVRLRLVGDGDMREELERLAADLGLADGTVVFAGRRDGGDLVEEYARADAFVLSSDREGMSLAAMEAMAAGLPVVATSVPGNVELLTDVGLLVDPDPRALAGGIGDLARNASLRESLARRGAARAREFTWDSAAAAVEAAYTKAGV